jgi:hypothetical protein
MPRRHAIIQGRFGSPALFYDHRRICKKKFYALADRLHGQINEIVKHQVALIEMDMQILTAENCVSESERDPAFKRNVGAAVERAKEELRRLNHVVGTDA